MIRYSAKLVIHVVALIAVVGAACWLIKDRSWEPALALLAAGSAYFGSLARVLQDQFAFGAANESSTMAIEKDRDKNGSFVSTSILSLVDPKQKHTSDIERVLSGAYGLLFRRLKILELDENGNLRPVSDRAKMFLSLVGYSAKADIPFCGDWKAEGTQNASARHLSEILGRMEEFRIEASGGAAKTTPLREVSSSLVLLKAMKGSEPVFLMRWSDAWGGYFWFVGGVEEKSDGTPEACARRELREELGLADSAIQNLAAITTVTDRRISGRLAVLTNYTYNLFSVAIDETHASSSVLLSPEFSLYVTVRGGFKVSQKCKWLTLDQIKASKDLMRDAGEIIQAVERFGIVKIPLTIQSVIR